MNSQRWTSRSALFLITVGVIVFGTGCTTIFSTKDRVSAAVQLGKMADVVTVQQRNQTEAISNLIDQYAAALKAKCDATWELEKLKIQISVKQKVAAKQQEILSAATERLDNAIDPILNQYQTQIQQEKALLDNGSGGDVNKLNALGAKFAAILAQLGQEKVDLQEKVAAEMSAAETKILSQLNLSDPSFTLDVSTIKQEWETAANAYSNALNSSLTEVQEWFLEKPAIVYGVQGFLGTDSVTDFTGALVTKFNQESTQLLNDFQSKVTTEVKDKSGLVDNFLDTITSKVESKLSGAVSK